MTCGKRVMREVIYLFSPLNILMSLLILSLIASNAKCDWDVGAKYASEFMTLGADGRASAMGETGTAYIGGPSAAYWNPAALTDIRGGGLSIMHADRFSGVVKYDFLSAVQRYSESEVFALTIFRLGVDDIPITALEDPSSPLGVNNIVVVDEWTSDSEIAVMGSYAFVWKGNWSLGVNGKILSKKVGDNSAFGLGFDVGARYKLWNHTYMGIKISDVTTTFLGWDTGHNELILPSMAFGAVQMIHLPRMQADLNFAFDLVLRGENRGEADQFALGRFSGDTHFGMEYIIQKTLALRVGMDREYLTAGAGIRIGPVNADYAFQAHEGLGESHRVSLSFLWRGNPFIR